MPIISWFLWVGSSDLWVLCFRNSHKVCGPGLQSHLETGLGKNPLPDSRGVSRSVPGGLLDRWTDGLSSSLVVGQRLFSVPYEMPFWKQHPVTFAMFWWLNRVLGPVHLRGEGVTQGHEHQEARTILESAHPRQ